MKEDLISFETAMLAKEKEFNEVILGCYTLDGVLHPETQRCNSKHLTSMVTAPTQSLLQKWLREVHNVILIVLLDRGKYDTPFYPWDDIQQDEVFFNFIIHDKEGKAHIFDGNYNIYEEALEIALQEGLKLIDNE